MIAPFVCGTLLLGRPRLYLPTTRRVCEPSPCTPQSQFINLIPRLSFTMLHVVIYKARKQSNNIFRPPTWVYKCTLYMGLLLFTSLLLLYKFILALFFFRFCFASGSPDNIKIWKLPDGNFLQNFTGHQAIVNTLAVNSDGVMVSGGESQALSLLLHNNSVYDLIPHLNVESRVIYCVVPVYLHV